MRKRPITIEWKCSGEPMTEQAKERILDLLATLIAKSYLASLSDPNRHTDQIEVAEKEKKIDPECD